MRVDDRPTTGWAGRLLAAMGLGFRAAVLVFAGFGSYALLDEATPALVSLTAESIRAGRDIDRVKRWLWMYRQTDETVPDIPYIDIAYIRPATTYEAILPQPVVRFTLRDAFFNVIYDTKTRRVIHSQPNHDLGPIDGLTFLRTIP